VLGKDKGQHNAFVKELSCEPSQLLPQKFVKILSKSPLQVEEVEFPLSSERKIANDDRKEEPAL
jgi:hypothetical protein